LLRQRFDEKPAPMVFLRWRVRSSGQESHLHRLDSQRHSKASCDKSMKRAISSQKWKTAGIALLVAAFGLFSYRWYTSRPIVSGIDTVNVGERIIKIRALAGYCNELDRDFFAPLERADFSREVIAVSAPCQDLTAFKTGRATRLPKYIVWSVGPLDNGSPRTIPGHTTRSEFANEMAESDQKFDLGEIASELAKNDKIGIVGQGLLDREVDAVYDAAILRGGNGRSNKTVVSVTGLAAIHHFAISITAYDDFISQASFSELLASVKSLMHAALSDNSGD
jgi:hypothetical protein